MNKIYYLEVYDETYNILKKSKPLKIEYMGDLTIFYLQNEFDLNFKILEKSSIIISIKNNLKFKLKFKLNVNNIIDTVKEYKKYDPLNVLSSFKYYDIFYSEYKYKNTVYNTLINYLPRELIDIIINYLKYTIDYSFVCNYSNYRNDVYLCCPRIYL